MTTSLNGRESYDAGKEGQVKSEVQVHNHSRGNADTNEHKHSTTTPFDSSMVVGIGISIRRTQGGAGRSSTPLAAHANGPACALEAPGPGSHQGQGSVPPVPVALIAKPQAHEQPQDQANHAVSRQETHHEPNGGNHTARARAAEMLTARTEDDPGLVDESPRTLAEDGRPMSDALILRAAGGNRRAKGQSVTVLLGRITHLQLQNKRICRIDRLKRCPNLQVLYLYDNLIERMENMECSSCLTHLYLQRNRITSVEGAPASVVKLFLDGNRIAEINHLDHLPNLQELSLASQMPSVPNATLSLSQGALRDCAGTLLALNLSCNRLTDLPRFAGLTPRLRKLNVSRNALADVEAVPHAIHGLSELANLDARGNPVCKHRAYYRDVLGACAYSIRSFDEKPISREQLEAIHSLERSKYRRAVEGRTENRQQDAPSRGNTPLFELRVIKPGSKVPQPQHRHGRPPLC